MKHVTTFTAWEGRSPLECSLVRKRCPGLLAGWLITLRHSVGFLACIRDGQAIYFGKRTPYFFGERLGLRHINAPTGLPQLKIPRGNPQNTAMHALLIRRMFCGQAMEATEGYEQLERRRRSKFDKQIANRVLLGSAGLDEGIDRNVKLA